MMTTAPMQKILQVVYCEVFCAIGQSTLDWIKISHSSMGIQLNTWIRCWWRIIYKVQFYGVDWEIGEMVTFKYVCCRYHRNILADRFCEKPEEIFSKFCFVRFRCQSSQEGFRAEGISCAEESRGKNNLGAVISHLVVSHWGDGEHQDVHCPIQTWGAVLIYCCTERWPY
jgi:hypothetical protein